MPGKVLTALYCDKESWKWRLEFNGVHIVPTSIWTALPSERRVGVNTVTRQLDGFGEENGGLLRVYSGSGFWCTVVLVTELDVGAVSSGLLVNYLWVGWARGTINFHFWETHSILLDFVEPIRAHGKKKKKKAKYLTSTKTCFHIQPSHNKAMMWLLPWYDSHVGCHLGLMWH